MKSSTNTSSLIIQNLRDLKLKLDSKQMSVLVGAGFSKNVSSIFPSWWELLFDMAYFLYGKEIEEKYSNIPLKKQRDKQTYIDNKISDFIDKIGYLDLVTEYINRKGYQESIATYIEGKTLKVIVDEILNKRYIVNKIKDIENKIELSDSMLDLHNSLINLPWNNIYTTNYDEMLELSNDDSNEKMLLSIEEEIESKIEKHYQEREKLIREKEIDEDELSILEEQEKKSITPDNSGIISNPTLQEYNPEIQEKKNKIHFNNYSIQNIESSIKKNDLELLKVKKEIEKCLKIVVHSSDLAIKRNRNIIKLHGSIRNENDKYGFDNDIRNHYVISREDYNLYPKKHEAFTQLMRISLLQESYCLIGFSGVDPNFLEWIKWVRDVLERSRDSKKNYKIYLIEVSKSDTVDDKELFYENFRICKISLDDDAIIDFLENETGLKIDLKLDRKKELLNLLFTYLKEENFETPDLFIEQYRIKKYKDEWNSVSIVNLNSIEEDELLTKTDEILSHYDTIVLNKNCSRIKQQDFAYSHNKKSLLFFSIKILKDLAIDLVRQKKLLDLILIAFEDMMLPINKFWNENEILFIESLLITEQEKNHFNYLKLRTSTLNFNKVEFELIANSIDGNIDFVKYEVILLSAFSLDFEKLKMELTGWNPNTAQYIIKKTGFLALFNPKEAENYLSSQKNIFEKSNIEELLFYYQTLNYVSSDKNYANSKTINSYISIIESKGFNGIHKHFDNLLEELKDKPKKLERYGSGRFSFSRDYSFSNNLPKEAKSIQFIQLLIEFGLPLNVGYYSLNNTDKWYSVFKNIFEEFPMPCLFYSLQYGDEKMTRRIAQDYAYSNELTDFINKILPQLLDKYIKKGTPERFKKSILYFCSELFIAVDQKKWQQKFYKVWNDNDFQEKALDERKNQNYVFVAEAIPFLKNITVVRSIILCCLNNYEDNTSIDFLYYFARSDYFFNLKSFQNKEISNRINELIPTLCENENLWFVIGNLNEKLSKPQILNIKKQLQKFDFTSINNERIWRVLYYFLEDDANLVKKFKKGLLNSKNLFNTGFNSDKSFSMGYHYVSLSFLNNKQFWTLSEVKIIYKRLLLEIEKIENWKLKRDDQKFEFMFQEMLWFLESESKFLLNIEGYIEVKQKIQSYYNIDKGFISITEAISSNDKSEIIWALSEMSELINAKDFTTDVLTALQLLLNRVLFQNDVALEATLNYLAVWIEDENNVDLFKPYKTILILIFEKYSKNYPPDAAIPFIQKQLIIIAATYIKYFGFDEIVSSCQNLFNKKKFYS